jgi:hypothetical protein
MPYLGKEPARVPVTAADIPDNSITAAKIIDGAISIADIANDAVTEDKLANSINTAIAANTAKTGITSGQASAITANTAKVTNATHTGDVTGSTALTIAVDAVDIPMLSATGTAGNTTFLRGDNTWATAGSTSASDLTSGTLPDARFPSTLPAISGANLTGITGTTTRAHAFSKNATGGLVWTHSESSLILKDGNNNDNYLDVVIGSSDQVYSINSDGQFILTYT